MSNIIKIHEGHKKLREFTQDDWGLVAVQFQGLGSLMGLKEISPQNTKIMTDFVRDEFKDFSFTEIQTAFKMNIAGKLLDNRGEKTKPYGSFNIDYVGTVLALYRKHRTLELKRINKAAPLPMKTEEQKQAELKATMEEIFQELNELFKQKIFKFTEHEGVKFFGCLKYYGLMPEYKCKILWAKAIEQTKLKYVNSFDSDSRKRIAYLVDFKTPTSDDIKTSIQIGVKNKYSSLLASKCVTDLSEFYSDLEEAKK